MTRRNALSLVAAVILASACESTAAQDFTGRWLYEENGESAELVLEHDKPTGRVSGTFAALGKRAPISGHADASALVIERVGDVDASPENGTMLGAVSGQQMILTITQPGAELVVLRLVRQGPAPQVTGSRRASTTSAKNEVAQRGSAGQAPQADAFTPSPIEAFAGQWEVVSDDGTNTESAEIEVAGGNATGVLRTLERGYFSGRVTVTAEAALRGTLRAGGLDLKAWDAANGSPASAVSGRAGRRGEYLIIRIGDSETGYARPGTPVVRSAEGSADAARFATAVSGHIYSSSRGVAGRGAFVGDRVRLALCSDGTIAFDVSDVATTGGADGVDMGDATSRRGEWGVVLLAGMPVVRAQWKGSGSSYSLTRYFRIQPHASSAHVDGTELPVSGSC